MPLSWTEIRHNAIRFSKEWAQTITERRQDLQGVDHAAERALAQSFWLDFFGAFGIRKEVVRSFEVPVKMLSGSWGYIDLFWKRTLLVEHKSPGKNLAQAEQQANDYIQALITTGRADEVPRYVIVSDFLNIVLEDRRTDTRLEIPLAALHKHIQAFAFLIPSLKQITYEEQDPINIEAAEVLGNLHDALKDGGYEGRDLEQFLVRILFCLFAEDTGIFELKEFQLYIENHTRADGADLGARLGQLFEVLNTPENKRQKNLSEELAPFPYVNGRLFEERLQFAAFNRAMRDTLIACCEKDWSLISPAIFGSLFQSIMQPKARRQIGAHYTSERDILKVVRSLFLDELRAEFETIKADRSNRRRARLEEFHRKLAALRFFDPACGCGNFLIVTYRELRQLELEVLALLYPGAEQELDVRNLAQVDVHQFYGIEIEPWPAHIAEVALWLMDHQMNIQLSKAFGGWFPRIPLKKSPHIVCGNALRLDWKTILPPAQCSYVLGNPPFVGKSYQTGAQRSDLLDALSNFRNVGDVDYVVGWFKRAAEYIYNTRIKVGFVATNSITQGEQVPVIWGELLDRYHLTIHFAHRPFPWMSEARGRAHVHVVVIGFGAFPDGQKQIYDYEADPENPSAATVAYISPYLTPGPSVLVTKQQKPLADVPEMRCGNKPSDGGHLILTEKERSQFLKDEPGAKKFLRPFIGSEEFINGNPRWCLWLADASPDDLRALPKVMERIEQVRDFRKKSTAEPTKKAAQTPSKFFFISQPTTEFIAIPEVSSERRRFIPIGFLSPKIIVSNKIYLIPSSSFYLFGVLSSTMHMTWMKQVGGRLESRFQYSGSMVYNTYPWPESATEKQRALVEEKAQAVLDARAKYLVAPGARVVPTRSPAATKAALKSSSATPISRAADWDNPRPACTLADLYDPLSMPPELVKAHAELDRAVEKCYRPEPFKSDRERVEFLFSLYEKLTAPLLPATAKTKRKKPGLYSQKLPTIPDSEPSTAVFHNVMGKEEGPPYHTD